WRRMNTSVAAPMTRTRATSSRLKRYCSIYASAQHCALTPSAAGSVSAMTAQGTPSHGVNARSALAVKPGLRNHVEGPWIPQKLIPLNVLLRSVPLFAVEQEHRGHLIHRPRLDLVIQRLALSLITQRARLLQPGVNLRIIEPVGLGNVAALLPYRAREIRVRNAVQVAIDQRLVTALSARLRPFRIGHRLQHRVQSDLLQISSDHY